MKELKLSEQFRFAFQQLKSSCNGSPKGLVTFFKERPTLTKLAWALDSAAGRVERIGDYQKIHSQVSAEFISDWRDYQARWRNPVAYVVSADIQDGMGDEWGPMPSYDEFLERGSDPYKREAPEAEFESEFVPAAHDGHSAISAFLELAEDRAHDRRSNGCEPEFIANTYLIGIEALKYFENVIGIDVGKAFDRWNSLPPVFVPKHVSDQHGLTSKAGLYALFDECVRTWVAGAPAASAAMCRALLELTLKEHYLRNDKTEFVGLKKLINLASARYAFINGEELHALREGANAMLHDYASSASSMRVDDANMLKIFRDLKHYIEEAPEL